MMEVRDLEFSYGDLPVVNGVSFSTSEEEIVSVLGPNGVGKTTLLRCICGLCRPSNGKVSIDGRDVSGMTRRELARLVAYVPQKIPPSRATVFDTALIGRVPHMEWGATRRDLEITSSVLESLGLSDIALKYTDEISGGELQKTHIARAIVQEPSILILDEPTNNLDIANQHAAMHTILDAMRSRGVCTIMTMHDINLAVHYSDRMMFVKGGRITAFGGREVVNEALIRTVYGMESDVIVHNGMPFVIPHPESPGVLVHRHGGRAHEHVRDISLVRGEGKGPEGDT